MANPKPIHSLHLRRTASIPAEAKSFVSLDGAPGDTPMPTPAPPAEAGAAALSSADGSAAAAAAPAPNAEPSPAGTAPDRGQEPTRVKATASGRKASTSRPSLKVKRKVQERLDGRKLVQKTVYLTPESAQRLAVFCATHGYEMSDTMALAIDQFLEDPKAILD
jgi:hypothetical protein